MKLLKFLLFIFFAIFWAREIPEKFKNYKEDKSRKNLLPLLGRLIMVIDCMILAAAIYL
ncbi:hypothetical protein [Peptoniphilus gorbachii]|uniref:Uncharacterized protein n=1 Tax=Peptoniphilus gorbachii TaxID=411567 RepID=A0A6N3AQ20_9FIRM|nr:hypothetical protein [Peptoniphilus harei]